MSTISDATSLAYLFKEVYTDRAISEEAVADFVLLNKCSKEDGLAGAHYDYFLRYANPSATGAKFDNTNLGASKGVQWQMGAKTMYGFIRVDNVALKLSKDGGAKMEILANEIEGAISNVSEALAHGIHRNGSGIRGKRASISTNTVTLSDPLTAAYFAVGMPIGATSTAAATALRAGTNTYVTAVDPAGTVTLNDASAITSFADNDYMLRPNDQAACMEGLSAIIPVTAPTTGDSFRGKDRSVDVLRLSGARIATNTSGATAEEQIGRLATLCFSYGKKPDFAVVHPSVFQSISSRLNAKRIYDGGDTAETGFQTLWINSPAGAVAVYADPYAHSAYVYMGRMSDLVLKHAGGNLVETDVDGNGMPQTRVVDADQTETRIRSISNLIIYTPAAFGVAAL